jgi:hypothetical protein
MDVRRCVQPCPSTEELCPITEELCPRTGELCPRTEELCPRKEKLCLLTDELCPRTETGILCTCRKNARVASCSSKSTGVRYAWRLAVRKCSSPRLFSPAFIEEWRTYISLRNLKGGATHTASGAFTATCIRMWWRLSRSGHICPL